MSRRPSRQRWRPFGWLWLVMDASQLPPRCIHCYPTWRRAHRQVMAYLVRRPQDVYWIVRMW